jgi:hypothetical protein
MSWRRIALAAFALGTAGCGGDSRVPSFPVSGQVLVKGEPASGAFVVFHPIGLQSESKPSAQVGPDGSFKLTTIDEADGAPAGDYTVTVQWWKVVRNGNDATPGPNVVPPPYDRPETSPIKVTVAEGENQLEPFVIK